MKPDHDKVRQNLGELATMSAQCEQAERQILSRATARLEEVGSQIEPARKAALAGGDEEQTKYQDLVHERGVLEQVIARAKQTLSIT
ncbi:hypothetical protein [Paraburkholderia phenoliruptrix]|uniref:hypothetical protein n=1 Tax=Paraburkholderia phenoliruptrix TaxID=252970 RepID=UPI0034CDB616